MVHPKLLSIVTGSHDISSLIIKQMQQPVCLLLLQILLILLVSRLFGILFEKMKQPAVIGEIVAGIVLGVSVFGNLFPHFFNVVFPVHSLPHIEMLSKIGLAFFMFIIGMELDLNELKRKAKPVLMISTCSIVVPFALGLSSAFFIFEWFRMPSVSFLVFSIFMGVSLSITAFPVLARIVKSRSLQKTPIGTLVLSIAAIADVMAWCLLAIIITIAKAGSFYMAAFTVVSAILFVLFMFLIVRRFLANLISKLRTAHYGNQNIIVLSFIVLLLSAFIAEAIGIHMLFGAFLAGVIIPQNEALKTALTASLEDVSVLLLLPIFFAFTGLRLQIGLLNSPSLWMICSVIIIIAMAGKFVGSAVPAKMLGMSWKDSLRIGAFMNTRGLMELVVLNIGYDLGILSPQLFAILVIMAIVTTIITSPLLDLIEYIFRKKNVPA